jgi:S-adenosylmethionine/arginine decarboxylase-like enzyme
MQKFFDENTQRSAELFRKAIDVAKCGATPEANEKAMALFNNSLQAFRESIEGAVKMNSEVMTNWNDFFKNASNGVAPIKAAK